MTPAALFTINIHTDITLFYTENECSRKKNMLYVHLCVCERVNALYFLTLKILILLIS